MLCLPLGKGVFASDSNTRNSYFLPKKICRMSKVKRDFFYSQHFFDMTPKIFSCDELLFWIERKFCLYEHHQREERIEKGFQRERQVKKERERELLVCVSGEISKPRETSLLHHGVDTAHPAIRKDPTKQAITILR